MTTLSCSACVMLRIHLTTVKVVAESNPVLISSISRTWRGPTRISAEEFSKTKCVGREIL